MLEGGREKFLVFAHHKLVLDHITTELGKKVCKLHRYHAAHQLSMQRNLIRLKRELFDFFNQTGSFVGVKSTFRSALISVCREQVWAALSTFELSATTV